MYLLDDEVNDTTKLTPKNSIGNLSKHAEPDTAVENIIIEHKFGVIDKEVTLVVMVIFSVKHIHGASLLHCIHKIGNKWWVLTMEYKSAEVYFYERYLMALVMVRFL